MRSPTVPPLLVVALQADPPRSGEDGAGNRVEANGGRGWRRGVYHPAGEGRRVEMWRIGVLAGAPAGWPGEAPFLPGISGVLALEGELLSMTWPDEDQGGDPGLPKPRSSVGAAEGGAEYSGSRPTPEQVGALIHGLEVLAADAPGDGWTPVSEEVLEGVVRGRVLRWTREGRDRAVTLTESLGVVQLTLMEAPTE